MDTALGTAPDQRRTTSLTLVLRRVRGTSPVLDPARRLPLIAAMTATDPSHLPPDHPAIPSRRIGVLLVNLGTPDATDYWSMRRYLKEFLSDRRVI